MSNQTNKNMISTLIKRKRINTPTSDAACDESIVFCRLFVRHFTHRTHLLRPFWIKKKKYQRTSSTIKKLMTITTSEFSGTGSRRATATVVTIFHKVVTAVGHLYGSIIVITCREIYITVIKQLPGLNHFPEFFSTRSPLTS